MLRKLALAAAIGVPALAAASSLAMAENPYISYGPLYNDYEYDGDTVIVETDEPVVVYKNYDSEWEGGNRLTCGQARDALEHFGFEQIVRDECSGSTYTFVAKRDGDLYTVLVNARTGEIIAG